MEEREKRKKNRKIKNGRDTRKNRKKDIEKNDWGSERNIKVYVRKRKKTVRGTKRDR